MSQHESILLTPGPVPIPRLVREALGRPIVHHRTPEFESTFKFCLASLKSLFETSGHVFIHASTGSGAMESAIVNTLSPGDEVLCVVSGKFGERWAYMAEVYGLKVQRMEVPWGESAKLEELANCLERKPNVKAVLSQACETSTAVLHPIREMSKLIHERTSALFLVDAITAMGCMKMPMKEWDLDVVVAGSQKAFMLPTGLSFVGVSKRALDIALKNLQPKFYFDWQQELEANAKNASFFSSPTTLINSLQVILTEFERVGIAAVQARCEALAEGTRAAATRLGLEIFSRAPAPSVTAILLPQAVAGEKLRDSLEIEAGVIVMGGQDKLKNRILRVGHMGDIADSDMDALFTALARALNLADRLPTALEALHQALKKAERIFT